MSEQELRVISLGGSLVAPEGIDLEFLSGFRHVLMNWLNAHTQRRAILVVGGGAPARIYQRAARELAKDISNEDLDWIGIAATRMNARLVRSTFYADAPCDIVENPETGEFDQGRILVASGWKPGFSTDYDAVVLAQRFQAECLINLSNIEAVYTADPQLDPQAKPLEQISWQQLQDIVGHTWKPGANWPFDPVATCRAREANLKVIVAKGSDLRNLEHILSGQNFKGTVISA